MAAKKLKNGMVFRHLKLSNAVGGPLDLNSFDKKSGLPAWLTLALAIIAYDIYAIKSERFETLTRSFWRITEKPKIGSVLTGVWLSLTFHLLIEKSVRKTYSDNRLR